MPASPDSITVGMAKFHFFREHFDFGTFPAYRSDFDGKSHFRFWADGRVMTPNELADFLEAEYVQQSEYAIRAAMTRYSALRAMSA